MRPRCLERERADVLGAIGERVGNAMTAWSPRRSSEAPLISPEGDERIDRRGSVTMIPFNVVGEGRAEEALHASSACASRITSDPPPSQRSGVASDRASAPDRALGAARAIEDRGSAAALR
jgi:hypothetical protein